MTDWTNLVHHIQKSSISTLFIKLSAAHCPTGASIIYRSLLKDDRMSS